MAIHHIIVSSNNNKDYLEFWEIFKKVCFNFLNIKPVLVKIDNINDFQETSTDIVIKIKKVSDNDVLQSQIARLWAPIFFKNKICMTSDIDMIPLSKKYFLNRRILKNEMHILSADLYNDNMDYYPMCYNIAYGNVFESILGLNDSFYDFHENVKKMVGETWVSDESFFSYKINNNENENIKIIKHKRFLNEDLYADLRIDRLYLKDINFYRNTKNEFIDFHCPRPYSEHKKFIDEIIDIFTLKRK